MISTTFSVRRSATIVAAIAGPLSPPQLPPFPTPTPLPHRGYHHQQCRTAVTIITNTSS
jgi:hypothetical protein